MLRADSYLVSALITYVVPDDDSAIRAIADDLGITLIPWGCRYEHSVLGPQDIALTIIL